MSNSTNVTVIKENDSYEDQFDALFAELNALEPFDVKKEELAAQLAALLSFAKVNRSDFARKSGWSRSRVTNILNGSKNLTYKTMWEFARQLGFEADLIFRIPSQHMALQPWQANTTITHLQVIEAKIPAISYPQAIFAIDIQSAFEVALDMNNGKQKSHYLSLIPMKSPDLQNIANSQKRVSSQSFSSIALKSSLNTSAISTS